MKYLVIILALVLISIVGCVSSEDIERTNTQMPDDVTWISPGKVEVSRFHPGAEADHLVSIHNGDTSDKEFKVFVQSPSRARDGYTPATPEMLSWAHIDSSVVSVTGCSTVDVPVTLLMPENTEAPDQWEFWVVCADNDPSGIIVTQLASRWLVEMR